MTTSQALDHIVGENVSQAIDVVQRRGYSLPTAYTSSNAVAVAAMTLTGSQAPNLPTLPTKAKEVDAWVADRTQALLVAERQREVAQDLADRARRTAMAVVVDELPVYLGKVCDEFDVHLEDFRRLVKVAPSRISSQMTGEQFEQHAELLRTVEALTLDAMDRARLALPTGEQQDTNGNAMWLILEPADTTTIQTVRDLLGEFSSHFPQTITDWARVDALGCKMARGGDVARRVFQFATLVQASGNARDGGLLDKSYGEARDLVGPQVLITGHDRGWEGQNEWTPENILRGVV